MSEPTRSASTIRSQIFSNCARSVSPSANIYSLMKHCCASAQKNSRCSSCAVPGPSAASRSSSRRIAVSHASSSKSQTGLDCNSASSKRFRRNRACALGAEQFGKPWLPRPRRNAALHRGSDCRTVPDQHLRIAQPQRHRLSEMGNGLVAAAKRLISHRQVVVRGDVVGVERKRLAEQFHRELITALLLDDVAQQDEARHMARVTQERDATQPFGRYQVALAVIGHSRRVNIFTVSGRRQNRNGNRRPRWNGVLDVRPALLPVHFINIFRYICRFSRAEVLAPACLKRHGLCLYVFYVWQ